MVSKPQGTVLEDSEVALRTDGFHFQFRWAGALIGAILPPALFSWLLLRAYLHWQGLGAIVPEVSVINSEFLLWNLVLLASLAFFLLYPPFIFKLFDVRWSQIAELVHDSLPTQGLRARIFRDRWIFWFYFLAFSISFTSVSLVTSWLEHSGGVVGPLVIILAQCSTLVLFQPWRRNYKKKEWIAISAAYLSSMVIVLMLIPAIRITIGIVREARIERSESVTWITLICTFAVFALAYERTLLLLDRISEGGLSRLVARSILLAIVWLVLLSVTAYATGAWKVVLASAAQLSGIRRECNKVLVSTERLPLQLLQDQGWSVQPLGEKVMIVTADVAFDYGPIVVLSKPRKCCATGQSIGDPWQANDWIELRREDLRKLSNQGQSALGNCENRAKSVSSK